MTLEEAVSITQKVTEGYTPYGGYETEHFFVFEVFFDKGDPKNVVGGAPILAIDKETKQTGYVLGILDLLDDPNQPTGWEQFRKYETDEDVNEDLSEILWEMNHKK